MVSTWMGDHLSVDVDAAVKNTVKSPERRNGGLQECITVQYILMRGKNKKSFMFETMGW